MAESVNSSGACKKPALSVEAPPPPEDMVEELPSYYVARKCKRCGILGRGDLMILNFEFEFKLR